ncbi:hypothetical protein U0070_001808, partial [Myodes glareolus]
MILKWEDWGIFPKDDSGDSHPDFLKDEDVDLKNVIIEKADTSRFQHIAVSCVMSVGGCKFKMSNWQRAINCCLEVLERDSSNTKALYHKIQVEVRSDLVFTTKRDMERCSIEN